MERTCANCVEIRDCQLRLVDGKMRPLCAGCDTLPARELRGPTDFRDKPFGGARNGDPYYPRHGGPIEALKQAPALAEHPYIKEQVAEMEAEFARAEASFPTLTFHPPPQEVCQYCGCSHPGCYCVQTPTGFDIRQSPTPTARIVFPVSIPIFDSED